VTASKISAPIPRRERLARLDAEWRVRGYTSVMVNEARRLADELGINPPVWAAPRAPRPTEMVSAVPSWHEGRREDQLRREWERWRYRRSKLPLGKRGPMMAVGQRQCKHCEGFFEPSTLRQRYCADTCRKQAHKRRTS